MNISGADARPIRIAWSLLLVVVSVWFLALVTRGAGLAPDEIEFFRATKWIGEGRVVYRDFWEHHTPLQWIALAPVARLFAQGPGVDSIVVMRWAQLPLWIGAVVLLARIERRAVWELIPPLALLLSSRTFVDRALEYRVDVPGNLLFLAALAAAVLRPGWRGYLSFGGLMSMAVLANMRMAPIAIVTGLLLLWWDPESERWRWNRRALWMAAGVFAVASSFLAWLLATGSWPAFSEAMFGYNRISGASVKAETFGDALLAPLWRLDIGGIVFWLAGGVGCVLALRRIRRPGPTQILALLSIASVALLAAMAIQYDYHLQTTWLLLVPLVVSVYASLPGRWQLVACAITLVAAVTAIVSVLPGFGARLQYQDAVMRAADRLTHEGETVFDGAGHALRREPAYRYWFLTTGVRLLARSGAIEAYDVDDVRRNPPGAIIYDYRLDIYLREFPQLRAYLPRHYVPVFRNLWVRGLSVATKAGRSRMRWTAARAGRYRLVVSESLAGHPWFDDPIAFANAKGPVALRLAIPLLQLPPVAGTVSLSVDGRRVDPLREFDVRKGAIVEIGVDTDAPAGVLVVPADVAVLGLAPGEEFVF